MGDSTEIIIDAEKEIGRVSPFIFGQNIEPATSRRIYWEGSELSDRRGFRKDVIEAARKIKIPIVRWPGGNFASAYHWEDGVGPREERPIAYDLAWGKNESNQFGTHELVEFCRSIVAEPFITVNAGSGTAEEAARWVECCNKKRGDTRYARLREEHGHPEPYSVKYWSIGNEAWSSFQVESLSAEGYARKSAEYAKLMKRVDPSIKIAAVGMYLGPFDEGPFGGGKPGMYLEHSGEHRDLDWNLEVLKTAGELIDYISVHRYYPIEVGSNLGFRKENYLPLLACPIHSERKLRVVNSIIDLAMEILAKDERIEVSYDEWHLGVDTLSHALATARFFNVLQRMSSCVTIACGEQWIATVLEKGILFQAGHLAFELYANHSGEIVLDTRVRTDTYDTSIVEFFQRGRPALSVRRVPYIDSSSTLSIDKKNLYIATVNAYENCGEECKIRLRDISVKRKGRVYELNGPDIMASNDTQNLGKVKVIEKTIDNAGDNFTYEFPPHSVTIIELPIK